MDINREFDAHMKESPSRRELTKDELLEKINRISAIIEKSGYAEHPDVQISTNQLFYLKAAILRGSVTFGEAQKECLTIEENTHQIIELLKNNDSNKLDPEAKQSLLDRIKTSFRKHIIG